MSKYGNTQCVSADGSVFASKRERQRYEELVLLQRMGKIRDLKMQVPYELIPAQVGERRCIYRADFTYTDDRGKFHCEDTKGVRTQAYIIKRKLMLLVHGIRIEEV